LGKKWNQLKREVFGQSLWGIPACRLCHKQNASHLHHALINKGKVKNRKHHKLLDVKVNGLEVCEKCHKFADAYKMRNKAYQINKKRYGKEVDEWLESLPFHVKEIFYEEGMGN